jgi:hypothetical protein
MYGVGYIDGFIARKFKGGWFKWIKDF